MPMNWPGRAVAAASWVIEIDEVLLAMMVPAPIAASTSLRILSCFETWG
jgi:hypothetical protein